MKTRLQVTDLCYAYGKRTAVDHVSFTVQQGAFVGLIGPNGSGKSTVLKTVYRALTPQNGAILLDGTPLTQMSYKETARKLATVGQENGVPFDFTVREMVAMGRSPHKRLWDTDTAQDRAIVHHALEHLGMEDMADRSFTALSGGEKQRVLLARAIAQESDFFLLDEPTNHLDISCQLQIFDFIKRLNITVLSAIHDLNMAALYCDYLYCMKDGKILLEGTPETVLTPENIYRVYGVRSTVERHPLTHKITVSFLPTGL